jgi:prevent-host-death family protein
MGSSKTVGARELKTRLGTYLRAVRAGSTILVTERGQPVAELRPVPAARRSVQSKLDELSTLGLITKGTGEPLTPFEPLRVAGRSISQTIIEDREDRV